MSNNAGTHQSARCALGRFVSMLSCYDATFRKQLATDGLGRRVAIPTFGSDSLHEATAIAGRSGGWATLVVPMKVAVKDADAKPNIRLTLVDMKVEHLDERHDGDWHPPVGPDTTVADLLKLLSPGTSLTFRTSSGEGALSFEGREERDLDSDEAAELADC